LNPSTFSAKSSEFNCLVAEADALGDDAGKGLAKKTRAVKGERQSVEECLSLGAGHLERIVWGAK